jgi:exodeoxyribonuclease VII small subunit
MSDKKKFSYREKREGLDKVITRLQSDDLDVDEALDLYKKAQEIIKALEEYLEKSENSIHKLKTKFDG